MRKFFVMLIGVIGCCGISQALDRPGVIGLNYTVGPSFLAGGSDAKDAGQVVGPHVGTALDIGLLNFLSFQYSYDYFDHHAMQGQDMMFSGIVHFMPESMNSPFVGFGVGFGKRYVGDDWSRFGLKLQGGYEHFVNESLSFAGVLSYNYINGPSDDGRDIGSLHMITPGVRVTYYFGHILPLRK